MRLRWASARWSPEAAQGLKARSCRSTPRYKAPLFHDVKAVTRPAGTADSRTLHLPSSRSLPPALRFFLQQRELDLLLYRIDTIHDHAYLLAHAVNFVAALADDLARVLVIHVTIISKRGQRHRPSTKRSVSSTKNPNLVTLMIRPSKSHRSINFHLPSDSLLLVAGSRLLLISRDIVSFSINRPLCLLIDWLMSGVMAFLIRQWFAGCHLLRSGCLRRPVSPKLRWLFLHPAVPLSRAEHLSRFDE